MKEGDFVRLDDETLEALGVGKFESHEDGMATVTFFDGPVSDLVRERVPVSALRPVRLSRQSRAYWFDIRNNVWRVGRVMDQDESDVDIRFPNQNDAFLPIIEVFVRWDIPLKDPTAYLAEKINETPRFSDARSSFVKALMAQRRASMGMPALLSSIIDLEPHQIEVVRRVLQDPVQRYLLADEVGLGKTIEAGVLIRQYVLDEPTKHRVCVIVPPALVHQWRDELERRFLLEKEIDDSVNVVPSDDPDLVRDALGSAGMVVVDEAHHVGQGHWLFDLLARETRQLSRFLLLSATPVLGNETGFLEMLHLLDPLVFPLERLDTFRDKIAHRQALAEAVAGLIPENLLQLEDYLDSLSDIFPNDTDLVRLASELRAIIDRFPEESDLEFQASLSSLRAHVGETYRLDRRILRNRRKGVHGLTPERAGISFVDYERPSITQLFEALEHWRSTVTLGLVGEENSTEARAASAWFFDVINGLATRLSLDALIASHIEQRLERAPDNEADALKAVLDRFELLGPEKESVQALAGVIGSADDKTKFIVFCSDDEIAKRLQNSLSTQLGISVDLYVDPSREDSSKSVFANFQNDPHRRVLVCDSRAEEGLNLQGGDKVLIHFDLPYSPNRIEQRIGRVDRYGTGSAVRSIAIRCAANPYELAWGRLLEEGFGVFNRSIASLQYLIDEEMSSLKHRILFEGLDAIWDMEERLGGDSGAISTELRRIDDQDALDALIVPSDENYDDLFDEDGNWQEFKAAVDTWLIGILQLQISKGPSVGPIPEGDAVDRYMLSHQGGAETLVPLDRFLANFLSVLDSEAPGASSRRPLSYPYTSRRNTALLSRARAQKVRLLRYGDTFLKGLADLTTLDDRGRSVAYWRQRRGYQSEGLGDLYFRFDFLIEANSGDAARSYAALLGIDEEMAINALRRRGDMVFPPTYHQVWLNSELEAEINPGTVGLLESPYLERATGDGDRDLNLNWERWEKLKNIRMPMVDYWSEIVHQAREKAEMVLREQVDLEQQIEHAFRAARETDQSRFAQLQTRIRHAEGKEASFEAQILEIEEATAERFYRGIQDPKITLELIGAVFLSRHSLDYLARENR